MKRNLILIGAIVLGLPTIGFSKSVQSFGSSFTAPAVDGAESSVLSPQMGDIVYDGGSANAFRGYDGTTWQSFSAPATVAARAVLASPGSQTIADNTPSAIEFNSESFDIGNSYDVSTHKFQPSVSGTYSICTTVYLVSSSAWNQHERAILTLRKNGSEYAHFARHEIETAPTGSYQLVLSGCTLVQFNGSTDYAQVYIAQNSGSPIALDNGGVTTHFSAHRVGGL